MKGRIINLADAKIKHCLDHYKKTGQISDPLLQPDSIFMHDDVKKHAGKKYLPVISQIEKELQETRAKSNIEYQKEFEEAFSNLKINFKTKQSKYKFPAILKKYREGMNPVRALYFCLQESLFKYDNKNDLDKWVIGLFKDEDWCNDLVQSLQEDCDSISEFQKKYAKNEYKSNYDDLLILSNVRIDFLHYIEVFSIMNEWDGD